MKIGIPKEVLPGETRVAMIPEVAGKLIKKGLTLMIQAGAGEGSHYPDAAYAEAGVALVTRDEALAADLVLKVRRPQLAEAQSLRPGSTLIALLESCGDDELTAELARRGVNVLALERIPRISRAQSMDVLSSQSNIGGYRAVLEAAAHFGRFFPVMMTAAGSAKPARLVVLGVGVAGLQAIATARRLGADVWAYDVRPETRDQIVSLGAKPIDLDLGESGSGTGGYARELSDAAKARQQELLANELAKAHVIITTALIPCRPAPVLVTEAMIQRLRPGSVVVDMAAAQGGNCPLTVRDEVVQRHGVILVGHTNYPAMVSSDASAFFARNLQSLLDIMIVKGDSGPVLKPFADDEITRAAVLTPHPA